MDPAVLADTACREINSHNTVASSKLLPITVIKARMKPSGTKTATSPFDSFNCERLEVQKKGAAYTSLAHGHLSKEPTHIACQKILATRQPPGDENGWNYASLDEWTEVGGRFTGGLCAPSDLEEKMRYFQSHCLDQPEETRKVDMLREFPQTSRGLHTASAKRQLFELRGSDGLPYWLGMIDDRSQDFELKGFFLKDVGEAVQVAANDGELAELCTSTLQRLRSTNISFQAIKEGNIFVYTKEMVYLIRFAGEV
ncbi:hypothetical protein VTN02DRAFT_6631 [Thermoascus thermophilus]